MKLDDVRVGKTYEILSVAGERNTVRRLLDMGFVPGRKVRAAHRAPFGGTVMVALKGFCIALDPRVARFIEVRRADN